MLCLVSVVKHHNLPTATYLEADIGHFFLGSDLDHFALGPPPTSPRFFLHIYKYNNKYNNKYNYYAMIIELVMRIRMNGRGIASNTNR